MIMMNTAKVCFFKESVKWYTDDECVYFEISDWGEE